MYKARYYKNDGKKAGDEELPIWLFDGIVNESVLHQAIRAYLLNQRQGSSSAKSRGEVRGGASKPWRQKGTGRSRQGTIRSPIWAGGGVAFPPKPKSWRVDLPKKVKQLAKRSAWNARAVDGRVVLVDAFEFDAPKTKQLREHLSSLELEGKVLVLTNGVNDAVYLSGRNLPDVNVLPFGDESAYDILWASTIVIERSALDSATEEAEARGLDTKAKNRIARAEARAEAAAAEEAAASKARKARRGRDRKTAPEAKKTAPEAKKAEPAKKEKAAPEAKKAAPAKKEKTEPEAKKAESAKKEKAGPKAKKAAAKGGASDAEAMEIPTVKDLPGFLAGQDDVETVRALQKRDERKTAQKHYEDRIAELTGEEGEDG